MPTSSLLKYLGVLVAIFATTSAFHFGVNAESQTASASPATSPTLASVPALPLFMQVGGDPNWTSLPSTYGTFYTYIPSVNVSAMSQNIKQFYLAVGTVPKQVLNSYPVKESDLMTTEENTFLHSTDPALLTLWKLASGRVLLTWQKDKRVDTLSKYRIYKVSLSSTYKRDFLWTEWWQKEPFTKLAEITAGSVDTYSYSDTLSSLDISNNALVCYMVKEVTASGLERMYSFPGCGTNAQLAAQPPVYLNGVKVTKLFENAISNDPLYADVGYDFDISLTGSEEQYHGYDAKLVVYNQVGSQRTANQQIGPLVEQSPRIQLYYKTSGGVVLHGSLKRPYLQYVTAGTKVTEDPVFRIAITRGAVTTMYPLDGGYYTLATNMRVSDRLWYGRLINPASSGWVTILRRALADAQTRGFNGAFFDTWAPDYPEQFTNDAPSIELNPGSVMSNQYTQALHKLGPILKTTFPSMTFFANTVNQIGDPPKEIDSIKTIDGGMSESCIISDGTLLTGDVLVKQLTEIESILHLNKTVLCWPKYQQIRWGSTITRSPFDEAPRIYALANALSILPGVGEQGKLLYGPEELYTLYTVGYPGGTIGQSINYFPEYRVPVGVPKAVRQTLGTYVWQRQFEKGVVVVNADPVASYTYNVPFPGLYKVRITGQIFSVDQTTQRVLQADPGTVTFESVSQGASVTLPPGSALVLVSNEPLGSAQPSINITSPTASTAVTIGVPLSVYWTSTNVTDAQLTVNLYRNNSYVTTLQAYVPVTQGSLSWNVPSNVSPGSGYTVAIGTLGAQNLFSVSSSFTISGPAQPTISITNPTAGTTATVGSPLSVSWTSFNVTDPQLTINLNKDGAYVTTLGAYVPVSQGSLSWTVPANIAVGSGYSLSIGTLGTQGVYAISPQFSIAGPVSQLPKITITSPSSGTFTRGGTLPVTWTSANITDPQLTINLNKDGAYVTTLGAYIPVSQGSLSWTIPASVVAGTGYSLSVATLGTQNVYAVSPLFSIQ